MFVSELHISEVDNKGQKIRTDLGELTGQTF